MRKKKKNQWKKLSEKHENIGAKRGDARRGQRRKNKFVERRKKKRKKKGKHTKREEIIRWRESQKVCVRDSSEARREGKDRLSSYRYEKRKKEKSANLVGPFG